MRLRNVPGSREYIESDKYVVNDPARYMGCWRGLFNKPPGSKLYLEIGMGKGKFLTGLAAANPNISFIGIEKFSSVIIRAVQKLDVLEYENIYVARFDAEYITSIFAKGEVDRIYLNFPDPWPKKRHAKRRLTSSVFLERYEQILSDGGTVDFKTDNVNLFDFSLEEAEDSCWDIRKSTRDLYGNMPAEGAIMTEYEEKFVSENIPICEMVIEKPPRRD